jgi:hypothetical protein
MGLLKRHNTRLKPVLTLKNMHDRISHVMRYIDVATMKFDPILNIVHIDEKWFNQDRDKRSYYLLDDEEEPHRTIQNKRFIPKTMFLCAVSRPR